MFGLKRIERALAAVSLQNNRILETVMATDAQVQALETAVNDMGDAITAATDRLQPLLDKLANTSPDDGDKIAAVTAQIRTEIDRIGTLGAAAQSATVETPPEVPATPVDTTQATE